MSLIRGDIGSSWFQETARIRCRAKKFAKESALLLRRDLRDLQDRPRHAEAEGLLVDLAFDLDLLPGDEVARAVELILIAVGRHQEPVTALQVAALHRARVLAHGETVARQYVRSSRRYAGSAVS